MAKLKIENTTLDGRAISGVASAIALTELGVCLDIGACTTASRKCDTVLVTHGHIDHLGAIAQHANVRSMMGGQKTRYIMPSHLIAPTQELFRVWETLQQGETPNYEFIPLDPGQDLPLGRNGWCVRAFPTPHRIPSQGYMLVETRQKLKANFEYRPAEEIVTLRKQGVVITEKKEIIRLAYTGDTRVEVLDRVPELKTCEVLIMESTFLGNDHDQEFASKRGHTHLNGILERASEFKNKAVVLVHFSARYDDETIAAEITKAQAQFPVPLHAFLK